MGVLVDMVFVALILAVVGNIAVFAAFVETLPPEHHQNQ
jgi:uncharacterized membrane protein YqhA